MLKYIRSLVYTLRHKYHVFIECCKVGLYWQGIVHDLSKFSLSEFRSYAWYFFHNSGSHSRSKNMREDHFDHAWLHHQHHNKHHWNHWIVDQSEKRAVEMPRDYLLEMVADWKAMSKVFGDSAKEYYLKNSSRIILHPITRREVEFLLGVQNGTG